MKIKKNYLISIIIFILVFVTTTNGCTNKDNNQDFSEEAVVIGIDTEYELQGKLTFPAQMQVNQKYPAVILIHGSGPNDMDSTIYQNKPFKDIAQYLAKRGIAVLRYDKRTYSYQEELAKNISEITVKEEIIDDALLATEILKNDSRIDQQHIYIIGHSLGGMVAPRIDAEGGDYSGLIMMAGSLRNYSDIIYDQNMDVINKLTGEEKEEAQLQLDDLMEQFDNFKILSNDELREIPFLGATGYYYKDLEAFSSREYLLNTEKPILVLQGEKDFQIYPEKDFEGYKELLQNKTNVEFILYPSLNHLFMISTLGNVNEYLSPNQVDEQVLDDIVNWILNKTI